MKAFVKKKLMLLALKTMRLAQYIEKLSDGINPDKQGRLF